MAFRFTSHLHRNRCGIFGFRIVVPHDLRMAFPFVEHRLTLRTSVLSTAKALAYILGFHLQHRLALIRAMSTSDASESGKQFVADLAAARDRVSVQFDVLTAERAAIEKRVEAVGKRLVSLLTAHEAEGLGKTVVLPVAVLAAMGQEADGEETTALEVGLDALRAALVELKAQDLDVLRQLAELAGESSALVQTMRSREQSEAVASAHAMEKKNLAEFTALQMSSFGTTRADSGSNRLESMRHEQGLDVEAGHMSVSELFKTYCEAHRGEWKNWEDRVKRDYNPVRDTFIALVTDRPIQELNASHSRRFTEHLKQKAISDGGRQTTVEKKVSFLRAVLWWARQETMLADLTGPLKVNAHHESYQAFNADDLRVLFESERYKRNAFGRAASFWLPLLGLYTGGRLEELASMQIAQSLESAGAPGLLLSPEGKASGKNDHSRRFVPLHSKLIAAGWLVYIETVRSEGHTAAFPCLPTSKRDGKGKAATRDFQKYRQEVGLGAERGEGRGTKVFHSFRATIITAMQNAGISPDTRMEITGHAKVSVHDNIYSQGQAPVKTLQDALESAVFDFRHPVWLDTDAYRYARKHGRAWSEPGKRSASVAV